MIRRCAQEQNSLILYDRWLFYTGGHRGRCLRHARGSGSSVAFVESAAQRPSSCTAGIVLPHHRVGLQALSKATSGRHWAMLASTSAVGDQTTNLGYGGDHLGALRWPPRNLLPTYFTYVTDVCNGQSIVKIETKLAFKCFHDVCAHGNHLDVSGSDFA